METPDSVIRKVKAYLHHYSVDVIDDSAKNVDYFGEGVRSKNNIIGSTKSGTNFRMCIRTQFSGGGAWQKNLYTYAMLANNEDQTINILVYHGTDKRFTDHLKWIEREAPKIISGKPVFVVSLSMLPRFISDTLC